MIYSDIDLNFVENNMKELTTKTDLDAIKQSINNIILTRRGSYTKYQNPEFGCGVINLLGEKINSATKITIQNEIEFALENFEPRIRVIEVNVDDKKDNTLYIFIKYSVISLNLVDELEINTGILK